MNAEILQDNTHIIFQLQPPTLLEEVNLGGWGSAAAPFNPSGHSDSQNQIIIQTSAVNIGKYLIS